MDASMVAGRLLALVKGGKMRVKLITRYAGPGGSYPSGAVVDLGADEADTLIAGGYAEAAEVAPVETTEAPKAPEKAVSRRGRAKRPAPKRKKGVQDG